MPSDTSGCPPKPLLDEGSERIPQTGPESAECLKLSTPDGVEHFVRLWRAPSQGPLVVHLHGIEGHSRWFESTALALVRAGISTAALDRRGAGKSGGVMGDIDRWKTLVVDVQELIAQLSDRCPHQGLFLMGNCWGGKVAAMVAANSQPAQFSGLIFTSPAFATSVDVGFATKLKIGLNYLLGGRGYFKIPIAPDHFTANPPYLSYLSADELRLKQATARFFIESLKLTQACRQAVARLQLPVLILQSGQDDIVDLKRIEGWFARIRSGDKTLKIFTTAKHSLDFEPDQAQYQSCLMSWIKSRASGEGTSVAS